MKNTFARMVQTMPWRDESGATAIEYALLATMFATFVLALLSPIGERVRALFDSVVSAIGG